MKASSRERLTVARQFNRVAQNSRCWKLLHKEIVEMDEHSKRIVSQIVYEDFDDDLMQGLALKQFCEQKYPAELDKAVARQERSSAAAVDTAEIPRLTLMPPPQSANRSSLSATAPLPASSASAVKTIVVDGGALSEASSHMLQQQERHIAEVGKAQIEYHQPICSRSRDRSNTANCSCFAIDRNKMRRRRKRCVGSVTRCSPCVCRDAHSRTGTGEASGRAQRQGVGAEVEGTAPR